MTVKSRVQQKCPKCDHIFLPSIKEVQSRAGASSRRKGANFERKVAKQLSEWWPGNHEFKRTPMSGGSVLKDGFDMAGDICTNAPFFLFHLELKNAPGSFSGLHNIFSEKSKIWKWLEQARSDCPDNKIPMLIVNRFDQPTWCIIDYNDDIFKLLCNLNINYLIYMIQDICSLCIWKFDDMLATNAEMWNYNFQGGTPT